MKSKQLLTLAAGALFACGSANAAIVLVDFGNNSISDTGWNTGITTAGKSNLVDSEGDATSIGISTSNFSDSGTTTNWDGRTQSPTWATSDSLTDRLFTSSGSASVTISGLDVNLTYDIELASGYGTGSLGNSGSQPATYELSGATGTSDPVEGFNAYIGTESGSKGTTVAWTPLMGVTGGDLDPEEGWLGWYNVAPSATGEITINVNADYLSNSASRGALNAMQITAVPEPSAYAALFGLFALGFVIWRRRRLS